MQPVFRTDPKKPFEQWSNDVRTIADHQCRHWLRTEYNTAVRRAHEAAEWQRFRQEADALPCLRWMPSTSAQPGADHRQFWGTVLPVGHPFWDSHRPGDRWNCKCSLEQTDDEPTAPPAASDDKPQDRPAPGLDTRPDREAQLFSPSHPYYRDAYRGAAQAARKAVDALMREMDEKEQLTAARQTYERLKADPDYTDVKFDPKSGGVKATHRGHTQHTSAKERTYFDGLTGDDLERQCQDQLFRTGHTAILRDESQKTPDGDYLPALDLELDGQLMDIRSITQDNPRGYGGQLRAKNKQLGLYNHKTGNTADAVCLYFHDASFFSEERILNGINYLKMLKKENGEPVSIRIKTIFCVVKGKNEIIRFDL